MRGSGARAAALATVLLGVAVAGSVAEEGVQGTLHGRVTWSGTVRVVADVEVAEDSSLTVEAGTRVVLALRDESRSGFSAERIEIHVKGEISVAGTAERPVVFEVEGCPPPTAEDAEETVRTRDEGQGPADARDLILSAPKHPRPCPWHGIVLWPAADPRKVREIRGALFSRAYSAIQVPKGRARVADCTFVACGTGIEVGSAWVDENRYGMANGVARPVVEGCRFARCGVGLLAESAGAPSILRCAFAGCTFAIGNERTSGWHRPLRAPGCTVDRCDLLGNGVGILGPCIVTSTLLSGNRTALTLSRSHTDCITVIDECAYRGNVLARNDCNMRGESALGEAVVVDAPGYAADEPTLLRALLTPSGPPLPEGLRLAATSPARGRAADGGDPGCFGPAVAPPSERAWTSAAARLRRPLAAEVETEGRAPDPVEDADAARLRPSPGIALRRSWWSRVAAGEDGTLRLREVFGRGEAAGLLAWRVDCPAGGNADLEVNGDLQEAAAWWNGERVDGLVVPRRFDASGAVLRAVARNGANHLVLRLRGRGADPRLGVALRLQGAAVPAEAEAPAGRPGRIAQAIVVRDRERGGEPFLRVVVGDPLAWTARGTVRLLSEGGSEIPARMAHLRFEDARVLRFGPLPEEALRGCGVLLGDFRFPDGAPSEFPPGPTAVPALPPR